MTFRDIENLIHNI